VFPLPHIGVTSEDPRNAGIIAYFRPEPVTAASVLASLVAASPGKPLADLVARQQELLQKVASRPAVADPPLSQSIDQVPQPWFGLGTHPDIITALWKLDEQLPQKCRWVLWGRPALVHPETGVVFAAAFGTIGIVLRLPPDILRGAEPPAASVTRRRGAGQNHDIGPAGPEWRCISPGPSTAEWCRAAYDFAGEASS
jgi:hypothetical protein